MVPQVAAELLLVVATETGIQPILLSSVKEEVGTGFTPIVVSVKALPQVLLPPKYKRTVYVPGSVNVIFSELLALEVQNAGSDLLFVVPRVPEYVYPVDGEISHTFFPEEHVPSVRTVLYRELELEKVTGIPIQVMLFEAEIFGSGLSDIFTGVEYGKLAH